MILVSSPLLAQLIGKIEGCAPQTCDPVDL